ncbi:protachykinin-like [Centroberyx affinis]|uniref:protachykinin-like n=1 Tax=Centroberyx affinis TaxID=166261 RepID=UPI003A5C098C
MRIVTLVVIALLLLANVFCQEKDLDNWRRSVEESKWPNSELVQDILSRMGRKTRPRQHLGLLGNMKASAKAQMTRRRHKFQNFVGLMGKRSFEGEGSL